MKEYSEDAVMFDCEGENLVGVISRPAEATKNISSSQTTGVIIIVGGPQYRAGSHRQFVLLARALASAGIPVLRFDYRGMGDSTGDLHTFENVNEDIAAAIGALQLAAPSVEQVVFWGLCDGASAALLYCHATQDVRVKGLCLLNPWVRSEASLAKTQVKHYYTHRLKQKEFWLKLMSGKVAAAALSGLYRNIRLSASSGQKATSDIQPFQSKMAIAWGDFSGPIALLLSDEDYVAKEFVDHIKSDISWQGFLTHPNVLCEELPDTDHTCSTAQSRAMVEKLTINWIVEKLTWKQTEQ